MEALFWGSPSMDLKLTIFLLGVAIITSLLVLIFIRRKIFSLLLFSILANAVFFMGVTTGSNMFDFYNIVWLLYFSFFIWPILNILLIVYYAKTSPKKK
jgi:hypothetical protein